MNEETIAYYFDDGEFRCKCKYANTHHPRLGWVCELLGCNVQNGKDEDYVKCSVGHGSSKCKMYAEVEITKVVRVNAPVFPKKFKRHLTVSERCTPRERGEFQDDA